MQSAKGFKNGNPALRMKDTSRQTIMGAIRAMLSDMDRPKAPRTPQRMSGSIWRNAGDCEFWEYLLPEGSRMIHSTIFVPKEDKLICLGSVHEVVTKALEGGIGIWER